MKYLFIVTTYFKSGGASQMLSCEDTKVLDISEIKARLNKMEEIQEVRFTLVGSVRPYKKTKESVVNSYIKEVFDNEETQITQSSEVASDVS